MNIEYKKLRSATNILEIFATFNCVIVLLAAQINRKIESDIAGIQRAKLPRHVYSPNSEASVSNDGKIPGFRKFLFLLSVIKFDNK